MSKASPYMVTEAGCESVFLPYQSPASHVRPFSLFPSWAFQALAFFTLKGIFPVGWISLQTIGCYAYSHYIKWLYFDSVCDS